ncbi:hypothetical protein FQN57_003857 [Myotisia sp. PD_48]|nr:hypothetical protein FQN57_003857 [Myotisia sp. PD_48]
MEGKRDEHDPSTQIALDLTDALPQQIIQAAMPPSRRRIEDPDHAILPLQRWHWVCGIDKVRIAVVNALSGRGVSRRIGCHRLARISSTDSGVSMSHVEFAFIFLRVLFGVEAVFEVSTLVLAETSP